MLQGSIWRPAVVSAIPPLVRPRVLAQAVQPRQVPTSVLAVGHTIALAMGAATAWVGFDTGARRSGFLSILGYVVGVGGAISAVIDLGILGVLGYRVVKGQPVTPTDAKTNLPLM